VSATEGESALTERVQRQRGNRWLQGSEGVRAIRSGSDGGRGSRGSERVEWMRAALLLSAAVRSPKMRRAQARVAPGSPELGRGEEGAMTNSMAGKGP
jgi:hypothetical protein